MNIAKMNIENKNVYSPTIPVPVVTFEAHRSIRANNSKFYLKIKLTINSTSIFRDIVRRGPWVSSYKMVFRIRFL